MGISCAHRFLFMFSSSIFNSAALDNLPRRALGRDSTDVPSYSPVALVDSEYILAAGSFALSTFHMSHLDKKDTEMNLQYHFKPFDPT
jgi:hypothetical protein